MILGIDFNNVTELDMLIEIYNQLTIIIDLSVFVLIMIIFFLVGKWLSQFI